MTSVECRKPLFPEGCHMRDRRLPSTTRPASWVRGLAVVSLLLSPPSVDAVTPRFVAGRLARSALRCEEPRILRPTIGLPVVVRPGKEFDIVVGCPHPIRPSDVRIELRCCDIAMRLEPVHVKRDAPRPWTLRAAIPVDAPAPVLYDLCLTIGRKTTQRPNAVQVVSKQRKRITLLQITDLEISHQNPGPAERLAELIREINLIAPDAVIATGDLTYDGKRPQFDKLLSLLSGLAVPVFTQIGNADYHGDASIYFAELNSYHDYAVCLGGVCLIGLDSGTNYKQSRGAYNPVLDNEGTGLLDEQIAWLESTLPRLPRDTVRLAMMHFPAVSQFGNRASIHFHRERFKTLCETSDVRLVLAGHTHVNAVYDANEKLYMVGQPPRTRPCYLQSATATSHTRAPFLPYSYRIVRIRNAKVASYSYDTNNDGRPDGASSVPVGRLTVSFEPSSQAGKRQLLARIRNDLNEGFDDARVTLRVPRDWGTSFEVKGGELLVVMPDGQHHLVKVQCTLPPRSEHIVRLRSR